jgi:hypothetical protein
MATLFERLSGVGLAENGGVSDRKMSIHSFCGAINELRRGKLTRPQVVAMFSLDAGQETSLLTIRDYINAAPDKMAFLRVMKDCLYLAEGGYAYTTPATFFSRIQAEITDQGGTLP